MSEPHPIIVFDAMCVLCLANAQSGDAQGLRMDLRRWWLGPLPLALAPRVSAREWEEDGRFNFDVHIVLPAVGRMVRYRGWLAADA